MDSERYESSETIVESFVISPSEYGLAVAVERCPLCSLTRRPIYCQECVNNGYFSKVLGESESFADRREKLQTLTTERLKLVKCIGEKVSGKQQRAAKEDEVKELKRKIQLLKQSLLQAKKKKQEREKQYSDLRSLRRRNERKVERSQGSVVGLRGQWRAAREDLRLQEDRLQATLQRLCGERRNAILPLLTYIFPLVELTAQGATSLMLEGSSLNLSMARELSDACQLAYMSGRWVHTDRYGNTLVKIVESVLPGNGDYSAGVTSEEESQELRLMGEEGQSASQKASYAVVSGLCYTTQLVHSLAALLHVHLPRHLHYSMFGCQDFSERRLQQLVSRLNHNVLQLCVSQGVDNSAMMATHTMHNLLLLLTRCEHLGKEQTFAESVAMVRAVNEGCVSEDEGGEEEEEGEGGQDWEVVDPPIHTAGACCTNNTASYAAAIMAGTTSTASVLVTSVASLWNAATGSHIFHS